MPILIDPVTTHDTSNNGNDTTPPGIAGLDWCHLVSTTSLSELTTFVTANAAALGQSAANIRTPQKASPSLVTYIGLTAAGHAAAVAAGAVPGNSRHVIANVFDRGATSLYEPIL